MLISVKNLFVHDDAVIKRPLAAVAADELALVTESIDRQLAVVAAVLANAA